MRESPSNTPPTNARPYGKLLHCKIKLHVGCGFVCDFSWTHLPKKKKKNSDKSTTFNCRFPRLPFPPKTDSVEMFATFAQHIQKMRGMRQSYVFLAGKKKPAFMLNKRPIINEVMSIMLQLRKCKSVLHGQLFRTSVKTECCQSTLFLHHQGNPSRDPSTQVVK